MLISSKAFYAQANNAEAALYNIGVGSIVSGIGAVINMKPEQKLGKTLLKGMAQGALGGYLVYESKVLVGKISREKELAYSWPAKIVNSAGISIIENAALNKDFWVQWNFHIGFNRFEFHTEETLKVEYKIMPAALLLTINSAIGNKFQIVRSLKTGEVIFSSDFNGTLTNRGTKRYATSSPASIVISEDYLSYYPFYTHELIHIYQFKDFNFLNAYVKKPLEKIVDASGFIENLDNLFYWDFQVPAFGFTYFVLAGVSTEQQYSNNFLEKEARFYARD